MGNVSTEGSNSGVTNEGTVEGFISTKGSNSGVTNSGTVEGAIETLGANSDITNSGTVGTFILAGVGGASSDVPNEGSDVTNEGTVGKFIFTEGHEAVVTNSGIVEGGIVTLGANSDITNSGTVGRGKAADDMYDLLGDGIYIKGADSTLILQRGSVIQGIISFEGSGSQTLTVANGQSVNLTFVNAPNNINSNGAPFAEQGTTVAVVDPTGLAAIDNAVSDLQGGIFGAVASRLDGSSSGVASLVGYADGAAVRIRPVAATPRDGEGGASWWFKGFGGYRDLDGSGSAVGADHAFGGTVMGVDGWVNSDLRLGTFAGLSFGRLEVDHNAQDIDTAGYFAGIYGRYGGHIDFTLTGGITDHDSERLVANNLVAGGLETTQADYYGYFIAPEVTMRTGAMTLGPVTVKPSLRARYSYLHLESYDESGSTADLSVEDRDIHTFDGRFALGVPLIEAPARLLELRAGIDSRVILGGADVEGTLLGQSLSFDPGGDEASVGGFVGAHYEERIWNNTFLFISTELGTGTETRFRADAQAGLQIAF